ncbi:hypothetical protein HK098_001437 [Nowakowskiella sp. JEL0407]|nr:hypothetical protein HK098_001437 [Nowakowskiella sp. JEL0407]
MANSLLYAISAFRRFETISLNNLHILRSFQSSFKAENDYYIKHLICDTEPSKKIPNPYISQILTRLSTFLSSISINKDMLNTFVYTISNHPDIPEIRELNIINTKILGNWYDEGGSFERRGTIQKVNMTSMSGFESNQIATFILTRCKVNHFAARTETALALVYTGLFNRIETKPELLSIHFHSEPINRDLRIFDDRWADLMDFLSMNDDLKVLVEPLNPTTIKTVNGPIRCSEPPISQYGIGLGFNLERTEEIEKLFRPSTGFTLSMSVLAVNKKRLPVLLHGAVDTINAISSRLYGLSIQNTDIYGTVEILGALSDSAIESIAQLNFRVCKPDKKRNWLTWDDVENSVYSLIPRLRNLTTIQFTDEISDNDDLHTGKLIMFLNKCTEVNNPHLTRANLILERSEILPSVFENLPLTITDLSLSIKIWGLNALITASNRLPTSSKLRTLTVTDISSATVEGVETHFRTLGRNIRVVSRQNLN